MNIFEPQEFLDQAIAGFGNEETDTLGINNIPSNDVTSEIIIPIQTTDDSDALLLPNYPNILNVSGLAGKDLLTGEVASEVAEQLKQFAADPNFTDKMNLAFDDSWNVETANAITQQWLAGDFSEIPEIEVVSTDNIAGADGAFAGATETIYISQEWLELNASNPGAIASVVFEEIGHYVDYEINIVDAAGDEGAIFSAVVRGEELSATEVAALKAEDDQLIVSVDGRSVLLEHSSSGWTTRVLDWDGNVLGDISIPKRSDGLNGIDVDWGEGSVVGGKEDRFIVRTWHQAYFDANRTYKFTVQGDDGFQIFTSPDGGNWTRFSDGWDFAYRDQNAKEYSWTPKTSGNHYVFAILAEAEGNAYLDLAWDEYSDGLDYSDGDEALEYMYQEMVNNAQSWQTQRMKEWNETTGLFENSAKASALGLWGTMVWDDSVWDHKPKLDEKLSLGDDNDFWFPIRGDSQHEYYYDIWSNIHYGYVGNAAGFDWITLQAGAGLNDFVKANLDGKDVSAVSLGFDLWDEYGTNLTPEQLRTKIINEGENLSRTDNIVNGE